jgi:hypothetical protein
MASAAGLHIPVTGHSLGTLVGIIENMNVILHPAAKDSESDHHGASQHAASVFLPYVDEVGRQLLKQRFPDFPNGDLFARGATVGKTGTNKTQWDKIAAGDVALFLRDNTVIGTGEVVYKLRSADLSRALGWEQNTDSGPAYELIYMVGDVRPLDLPRQTLWKALGYNPGADQVGLRVLDAEKTEHALQFLREHTEISSREIEQLLALELDSTDVERRILSRKEQYYWRLHLFGKSPMGECAACGLILPVELLVAAHIKPRCNCTREERLDPSNIIPMCLLGCDALFEQTYMTVDPDGYIRVREGATGALRSRLNSVDGRRIARYLPACGRYYDSRANRA